MGKAAGARSGAVLEAAGARSGAALETAEDLAGPPRIAENPAGPP